MICVFQSGFCVTKRQANALLNGNMLSVTVQAATGDLFNAASNRELKLSLIGTARNSSRRDRS
ncbi:MAG: hypothetical protein ABI693_20595 [Bryobacteraceae bacterium]